MDKKDSDEFAQQRASRFVWSSSDIVIIKDGKEVPPTPSPADQGQSASDALPDTISAAEPKLPNKDDQQDD